MKRHRAAIVFIKEMTGICKYLAFVKYGHDVPLLTIVILHVDSKRMIVPRDVTERRRIDIPLIYEK